MRNTDSRFSSSNETPNNIRYPIHYIPIHNQNQNIFYPAPIALHLTPSQINNGSHLNNNVLYQSIYQIGHQQLMLSSNPHLVISVPCAPNNLSDNTNLTSLSSVDSHMSSSVTSPTSAISTQCQNTINYSLCKWIEIHAFYDGNDDMRPSAGQLRNGKYFTQRSAGRDIYMVFNSKADYINNFVNYYFSNKNLTTDEKLFNLMDDNGSVALSDLIRFPRLAQISTTIDDIVEALKFSHFVIIVNLKNESKGIRRSDGWFPSKLIDESQQSVNGQWSTTTVTNSSGDSYNSASLKKSIPDTSYRNHKLNSNTPISMLSQSSNSISSNPNNLDLSVVNGQIHLQNSDSKTQIDNVLANNTNNNNNNSMVYFNQANNGSLHQSLQYTPTAYIHGLHQNNFPSLQAPASLTSHNVNKILSGPSVGHGAQLILNTQQHYSNPTFFQHNQPVQLRAVWPGQHLTELTRDSHMLYSSNNNNNVRHVIGAGGNNLTNYKQCQY